jgi:hypothetical protein
MQIRKLKVDTHLSDDKAGAINALPVDVRDARRTLRSCGTATGRPAVA